MKIGENTAKLIVAEISGAIDQPINLMDETGRIIASTDPTRIGTIHDGAHRAIREGLDCLIVRTDDEYSGSRIGINLPIHYRGEAIGVIGITGDNYDELSRYIRLIRTTTETMLRDRLSPAPAMDREEQQQVLLEKLLFAPEKMEETALNELGARLGADLSVPYCTAVIEPAEPPEGGAARVRAVAEAIRKKGQGALVYRALRYAVLLLPGDGDDLRQWLEELKDGRGEDGPALAMGYDGARRTGYDLREGFSRARDACRAARLCRKEEPLCWDDLVVELLLPGVTAGMRETYLRKVFGEPDGQQLRRWRRLLTAFYACDGSIERTAERLFTHKNTVQYQLRKIAEHTGYDPRKINNAAIFQLALMLSGDMQSGSL